MALGYRGKINVALGAGLALLVVFGVASFVTIQAFLDDARVERESQEAVLMLERAVAQMRATESWQRKFLITANADDLQAYRASRVGVNQAIAYARRAAASDAQGLLGKLESTIGERLQRMDLAIRLRQDSGFEAAGAIVGSDVSRQLRERIDELVDQVKRKETALLQESHAEVQESARDAERLIMASGLVAVALLAWAIYLVNHHETRRQTAQAGLDRSMAELSEVGAALRTSETQLRQVMDSVPTLIAYVDDGLCVQFHNRAYADSLALPADAVQGRHLRDVLGVDLFERAAAHAAAALQGLTATYERAQRTVTGSTRDYEIKYFPRHGEGERWHQVIGFYVMGSDVTEYRRIDRMKSEFVSTVSHELRTPLTSIRGSLGLIVAGMAGELPPHARQLAEIARNNCERLVRLINDILDIEKIASDALRLEIQPTELRSAIEAALAEIAGFAAQRDVTLSLEGPRGLVAAIDTDRFTQVVTNLVSNAVKFSPASSRVDVTLAAVAGARVRIAVQDQGPGIAPEFRARVFGRFSQADASDARQKGGTGLGLSISKALVERMGGEIGFHSVPGAGAVFYFELPGYAPVGLQDNVPAGAQER